MRTLLAVVLSALLAAAQDAPSLPWFGTEDAIAEYMRTAPIVRMEDLPVGVTRPRRAILATGGLVGSIVVKDLRPGRLGGYWESYKSEIAAYELDRLLELHMVPPTVERRVDGRLMSAQMFVDRSVWLKTLKGQQAPNLQDWNRQVHRHRVFDNLIANIDRNAGNLLVYGATPSGGRVTGAWHLILIDHSRCFTSVKKMRFPMTRIDRPLFERLKALDAPTLEARIGSLLPDGVKSLLDRRDIIVAHYEALAAANGENRVFTPD